MNDEFVAGKILDILRTEKYCHVAAKDFLQLWFRQTNGLNEAQFTEKLLRFAENNKLDYIIKMAGNGRTYDTITFWKIITKNPKIALLEDLNGQDSNDREEESDGRGDAESSSDIRERNGTDG